MNKIKPGDLYLSKNHNLLIMIVKYIDGYHGWSCYSYYFLDKSIYENDLINLCQIKEHFFKIKKIESLTFETFKNEVNNIVKLQIFK